MWNVRSRVSIRRLETPAGRGSGCEGAASRPRDDMVETEREWVFGEARINLGNSYRIAGTGLDRVSVERESMY